MQTLEFNYFSKTKFDYSVRREDLINEAIDLSAKVGDWEKFCELCIEAGEWEKAIMAAPHVSLSYWKDVTKKYSDFCLNKNNNEKKFSSLLSNELQPALSNFMEAKDYEDAKLLWLTRDNMCSKSNNTLEKSINFSNGAFNMDEETIKKIDNKLKSLTEEDELFKISYLISRDYLTKGFPIYSAGNYLSIKNYFHTLKTLVRSNELEIAYMLMEILGNKTYEEDIIFGLCLKELKRGNM